MVIVSIFAGTGLVGNELSWLFVVYLNELSWFDFWFDLKIFYAQTDSILEVIYSYNV